MPSAYKILGQNSPAATILTDIYTVPALTQAIVSTITVCNRANTSTAYRLSQAIAGAADAVQQYLAYDAPIAGNSSHMLTVGLSLGAADKIRGYSTSGLVSFNISGTEITP